MASLAHRAKACNIRRQPHNDLVSWEFNAITCLHFSAPARAILNIAEAFKERLVFWQWRGFEAPLLVVKHLELFSITNSKMCIFRRNQTSFLEEDGTTINTSTKHAHSLLMLWWRNPIISSLQSTQSNAGLMSIWIKGKHKLTKFYNPVLQNDKWTFISFMLHKEKNIFYTMSVKDELMSLSAYGRKLFCSLVVQNRYFCIRRQIAARWTDCGWGKCCLLVSF